MNFLRPKHLDAASASNPRGQNQLNLHYILSDIQNHCSAFLSRFPHFSFDPKTLFESTISNIQYHAPRTLPRSGKAPLWARIAGDGGGGMPLASIEERLAGVPVYALSNSSDEFVLVTSVRTGKSLGLFCLGKEDAETLLEQMKLTNPKMRQGSKVVAVALNKVVQLKLDGVAFRLMPNSTQIKNALREMQKAGLSDTGFSGVPVFQSRSLILQSQDKKYQPVFFRKEDLENSLFRASNQQNRLNPAFRQGDIQVVVFEEIIKGMQEGGSQQWDDVIFIPPGFDASASSSEQQATAAAAAAANGQAVVV